jgi:hypothetical protein
MKEIKEHKIEYSIDYDQYWQGVGVSCTQWDEVCTGVGSTYREAYDDMVDAVGQYGYNVDTIPELDEKNEKFDEDVLSVIGGQIELLEAPDDAAESPMFYVSCYILDGQYLKTCDQCNPIAINGHWLHESSTCPNAKKRFDHETGGWEAVYTCRECGYEYPVDEPCNCGDIADCLVDWEEVE